MLVPNPTQFGDGTDDIDIGDIARTLWRHARQIGYFALAGTLIALFLVLSATPNFSLTGNLYFGESQSPDRPAGANSVNLLTNFQSLSDVATAVALLQYRALIEQAILETGLNATAAPVDRGPMTYWRWRFEDRDAVDAYAPRPGDLVVEDATLFDPGSGGGEFTLKFGADGQYQLLNFDTGGPPVLTGTLNQPAAGHGVTLMVKLAVDGAPPPAGSTYVIGIAPAKSLADQLIGKNLKVVQGGQATDPTQTANITFLWSNPFQGQLFVNQLMKDFIATQLSWKTESASDTQQFIAQQIQNIKTSLNEADNKLASYQSQTGIVDVPANGQAVVNQLSQYEVQRTTAELQEQALQQLVASTSEHEGELNPYLVTQASDPVLAQLAGSLANAEVLLSTQNLQFTPNAPELQAQQTTVSRTEAAIRTLLRNDEKLAAGNVSHLDALISNYQNQLKSLPAQSLQITELTRASNVFGQLYVLLMQDEEEAEVSKAATIVDTRIVSPAEVPLSATSPKATTTVVAGFILGLLLGIFLVLARRVLSGQFHSEGDVRRTLSLPVLGLIPASPKRLHLADFGKPESRTSFNEAFRLLRNYIYQFFAGEPDASRVVLITSAAAHDGKTTVAIHLARAIGEDGKRVLLVDGDLHRGQLHEVLGKTQKPGFSELLAGRERSAPQPVAGQNFSLLSAGAYAANPPSLLKDSSLAITFKLLREEFDYIIIDCPPLPSVVDTLILGKFADLILSVIYLERTRRGSFNAHEEMLRSLATPKGIVVNGLLAGPHYQARAYADVGHHAPDWRRYVPWRRG